MAQEKASFIEKIFPLLPSGKRKILCFGGSFDPPHLAHVTIAQQAITNLNWDIILWIPVGEHPHQKKLSSSEQRLSLLQKAIDHLEWSLICPIEMHIAGKNYFYDTFLEIRQHYEKTHTNLDWGLLIGEDQAEQLIPTWYQSDKLIKELEIVVATRSDLPHHALKNYNFEYTPLQNPHISMASREIRILLTQQKYANLPLAPLVLDEIRKNDYYTPSLQKWKELREILRHLLPNRLSEARIIHTKSVARTAHILADLYWEEIKKELPAKQEYAIFYERLNIICYAHDLYRESTSSQIKSQLAPSTFNSLDNEAKQNPILAHGHLAAQELQKIASYADENLLRAVEEHTFGALNSSVLSKLLYCADKIEPRRDHIQRLQFSEYLAFPSLSSLYETLVKKQILWLDEKGYSIPVTTKRVLEGFK